MVRGQRLVGTWLVGMALVVGLVSGLARAETAVAPLARLHDPVVVPGSALGALQGAPLAELALLAYRGGSWAAVPFQIDEVNAAGAYVGSEDGLLDGNDELVFMPPDAGDLAPPGAWVADDLARLAPRAVITVTDPLNPAAAGWAYLYRSTTLPRSPAVYVSWDAAAQTATAVSYTLRFAPQTHLGIADLALNGAPADVLDRQKLRAQATLYVGSFPVGSLAIDEASILNFITTPVTISLPIAGPVRAVGGSATQQVALYASRADLAVALDVAEQPLPGVPGTTVQLDALRLSLDLLDPAASGLAPATYYDSNTPAGAAIDGMPDAVPVQPLAGWQQVAGAAGGFVNVLSVTLQSGTVSNHYLDDAALDPGDTGDGRSFGDAGFAVANPDGRLTVRQVLYFLPGGAGNVGAAFAAQAGRALQVETAVEPPVAGFGVYLAVVKRN